MNNIPHLCDLDVYRFFHVLENSQTFTIQEKVDGNFIEFGFDKHGFYTSRESKGKSKKYRTKDDYDFFLWTNSFRSAHNYLESISSLLFQEVGYGKYSCEVLYGRQPNTIDYNLKNNCIVFFDPIFENIAKKLSTKSFNVRVVKQKDGKKTFPKNELQTWEAFYAPVEKFYLPCFYEEKQNLKNLLDCYSNIGNLKNKDILNIKLNKYDPNCSLSRKEFLDKRPEIKLKRESLSKEVYKAKKDITNKILNFCLEAFSCYFNGKKHEVEGFVLSDLNGDLYKIVDKDKFTFLNKFYHQESENVRKNIWQPFLQEIKETKSNKTVEKYNSLLLKELENYQKRQKYPKFELQCGRKLYYNNQVHEKTLEYFAQTFRRIGYYKMLKESSIQDKDKTYNSFSSPVSLDEIYEIMSELENLTKIGKKELELNFIGSTGRKKISNDIDIAIDKNKCSVKDIKINLAKKIETKNIKYSASLDILHVLYPFKNKNIQIDFVFTENPEWTRFAFYSAGKNSGYKGAYRARLMSAIAASSNDLKFNNDEIIKRTGWVWSPKYGLQWQSKIRTVKKNGELSKNFKVINKERTITDPKKVTEVLFGTDVMPSETLTVENLLNLINQNFDKERISLIKKIYKQGLIDSKLQVPKELFK